MNEISAETWALAQRAAEDFADALLTCYRNFGLSDRRRARRIRRREGRGIRTRWTTSAPMALLRHT